MKLSEDILDAVKGEHYSVTIDLFTGWADKAARLEAENEMLKYKLEEAEHSLQHALSAINDALKEGTE